MYILIGFGPEVYLAITRGKIIFATNIDVFIIIMSSFDTPASISFNGDTLSVAANPTFYTNKNIWAEMNILKCVINVFKNTYLMIK